MCFIQTVKNRAAESSNLCIKILYIYSHIYIYKLIYIYIYKFFLGKGRLDTMKIEILRKGNIKKEWRFIQG